MNTKLNLTPMKLAFVSAFVLGSVAVSTTSQATEATANLDVSAEITSSCSIATSALAFGTYDPIVTNKTSRLNGSGTVTVACTLDDAVNIKMDQGANPDTGSTDGSPLRRMNDGGSNNMNYALFVDPTHSVPWANTDSTDKNVTGTGSAVGYTVYGHVPAGQNTLPAGSYTDTVVATVTF